MPRLGVVYIMNGQVNFTKNDRSYQKLGGFCIWKNKPLVCLIMQNFVKRGNIGLDSWLSGCGTFQVCQEDQLINKTFHRRESLLRIVYVSFTYPFHLWWNERVLLCTDLVTWASDGNAQVEISASFSSFSCKSQSSHQHTCAKLWACIQRHIEG